MSYSNNIRAGENIYLEEKDDEVVIHCSPQPSPQSNIHTGFFRITPEPEPNARLAIRISNCIFRVNSKYFQIADYSIRSYYAEQELIYLKLNNSDPFRSQIHHELVFNDVEDARMVYTHFYPYLLKKITKIKVNSPEHLPIKFMESGGKIISFF